MQLSFEFFPPRTEKNLQAFKQTREQLKSIKPQYFSVTFGAGGSIQEATIDSVLDIQKYDNTPAAPHISCIDSNKSKIVEMLNLYRKNGINRLVIIRGDIPSGVLDIGCFRYASELVEFVKLEYGDYFNIKVAAYPETHPQANNVFRDIEHFVNKIKAGADGAITQYFYNADAYFRFIDEVNKFGIDVNITPGIMPITNHNQLLRFSNLCGAEIPRWILQRTEFYKNDLQSLALFGEEVVSNLCYKLKSQGVEDFHFYTLNRAQPTLRIAQTLL